MFDVECSRAPDVANLKSQILFAVRVDDQRAIDMPLT